MINVITIMVPVRGCGGLDGLAGLAELLHDQVDQEVQGGVDDDEQVRDHDHVVEPDREVDAAPIVGLVDGGHDSPDVAGHKNPHDQDRHPRQRLLVLVEDPPAEGDAAVGLPLQAGAAPGSTSAAPRSP